MLAAGSAISILPLLPELVLAAAGCFVLILGQGRSEGARRSLPWVTLVSLFVGILVLRGMTLLGYRFDTETVFNGLLFDSLADFVRISALILGVLIALSCWAQRGEERGEFFSMMLFAVAGLMLVGPSVNLFVLFLAIELVSIPTYIIVTLSRGNPKAAEAGTKYFYLGALAAAITAFGFAYLYGVAGRATMDATAVERISAALRAPGTTEYALATIGILLSFVGLLFKIAAFPLHFYIADVYEGASSPVAGLLGFVPKLAGLVAILKVLSLTGWTTTGGGLFWVLWIVAAVSMTYGNVMALRQTSIKRMLAYSGVAHAGYMVVGLIAGPSLGSGLIGDGAAATLYYVVIYGIANLGAFTLLGLLRVRGRACETVRDVAGLLREYPSIALLLALTMFTLMGLPPTPGFWGKMALFGSALAAVASTPAANQTWLIALVIIAVLNSALAAAYYLRVIASVLLYENDEPAEPAPREMPLMGALLCGFLLLFFAFYPNLLMTKSLRATASLEAPPITQVDSTPLTADAAPQPDDLFAAKP